MTNEKWIVEGFSFHSKQEYEKALKEQESITYLKAHSDLKNGKSALKVYMNLVEKDIFRTVIGYTFMENLRRHIINKEVVPVNMIPVVPVKLDTGNAPVEKKETGKKISESALQKQCDKLKQKHSISMYLNAFLIIIVISMFAITYYSPKNNEDVAREKIQNEYSEWQQNLEDREKALEEKASGLKK